MRESWKVSSAALRVDASLDSFEVLQAGKKLIHHDLKMVLPWFS